MENNLYKEVYMQGRIGTVQELVNLKEGEWSNLKFTILLSSSVYIESAEHQYSKLAFVTEIEKLRSKLKNGKN